LIVFQAGALILLDNYPFLIFFDYFSKRGPSSGRSDYICKPENIALMADERLMPLEDRIAKIIKDHVAHETETADRWVASKAAARDIMEVTGTPERLLGCLSREKKK
jgi:hypothetical protein